ncbi:porin family protein [Chitinophaga sedimenti]|uniref:outer membrane beta-barrel protein n=1 Tax=Chitinophaga sedimenti TaxID=2033606 RepID=UPI002004BA62|nr:outer membrane beta-barrel protein [Chitinophaga sedimenti]MCK7559880.1 porin family protein [Chitinophaga sedimenti]
MKKLHFLTAALISLSSAAMAQTQRGNVMVGANLLNVTGTFQDGSNRFQLGISPKAAWFIRDGLAIGADVSLGLDHNKVDISKTTAVNYGIGAFGRYYINDKNVEFSKRSKFFPEGNVGFTGNNTKTKIEGAGENSVETNGLGIGFGPGLAYFITPNVAPEALVKYDRGLASVALPPVTG